MCDQFHEIMKIKQNFTLGRIENLCLNIQSDELNSYKRISYLF